MAENKWETLKAKFKNQSLEGCNIPKYRQKLLTPQVDRKTIALLLHDFSWYFLFKFAGGCCKVANTLLLLVNGALSYTFALLFTNLGLNFSTYHLPLWYMMVISNTSFTSRSTSQNLHKCKAVALLPHDFFALSLLKSPPTYGTRQRKQYLKSYYCL